MKFEPPLSRGLLIRRYKRFLADVETAEGAMTVHCPNTGAMTGCAEPGMEVWYSRSTNPARKYPCTLEVVCTPAGRVGVNTGRANSLVAEALAAGRLPEMAGYRDVRREVPVPEAHGGRGARFDFRLERGDEHCWLEVKSLTLGMESGRGAFPDAVSDRAVRHVEVLAKRRAAGDRAVLLFCVQHTGVRFATPADEVHPEYGAALRAAADRGVEVLAYTTAIDRQAMAITTPVPVLL